MQPTSSPVCHLSPAHIYIWMSETRLNVIHHPSDESSCALSLLFLFVRFVLYAYVSDDCIHQIILQALQLLLFCLASISVAHLHIVFLFLYMDQAFSSALSCMLLHQRAVCLHL